MPAYYLFDVEEVTNPQMMDEYRQRVLATVQQFGGRYLTVGGAVSVVEGTWKPTFPVLIEFPSIEKARQWYDSDVYAAIKHLRTGATRGHAILIDAAPFQPG